MAYFASYQTGEDNAINTDGNVYLGQSFIAAFTGTATSIGAKVYATGDGRPQTQLYLAGSDGKPTGSLIYEFSKDLGNAGSPSYWIIDTGIAVEGIVLTRGTKYVLVMFDQGDGSSNWSVDTSSPTYTSGNRLHSTNAGSSWTLYTGQDFLFYVDGNKDYTAINEVVTYRRLVSVGNSKVYYEDI